MSYTPVTERIATALERIADALESANEASTNLFNITYTGTEPETPVDPENLTIDLDDVDEGQIVTFTYQGEKDDYARQRVVQIEDRFTTTGGVTYLIGVDVADKTDGDYSEAAHRTFRSDRIKSPIYEAGVDA